MTLDIKVTLTCSDFTYNLRRPYISREHPTCKTITD